VRGTTRGDDEVIAIQTPDGFPPIVERGYKPHVMVALFSFMVFKSRLVVHWWAFQPYPSGMTKNCGQDSSSIAMQSSPLVAPY